VKVPRKKGWFEGLWSCVCCTNRHEDLQLEGYEKKKPKRRTQSQLYDSIMKEVKSNTEQKDKNDLDIAKTPDTEVN